MATYKWLHTNGYIQMAYIHTFTCTYAIPEQVNSNREVARNCNINCYIHMWMYISTNIS